MSNGPWVSSKQITGADRATDPNNLAQYCGYRRMLQENTGQQKASPIFPALLQVCDPHWAPADNTVLKAGRGHANDFDNKTVKN